MSQCTPFFDTCQLIGQMAYRLHDECTRAQCPATLTVKLRPHCRMAYLIATHTRACSDKAAGKPDE